MNTLGKSFFNQHSTPAAHLGRVARVHLHHNAPSFFRFGRCELYQLVPCYVRNAFSQAMVLNHPVNVQILKCDKAVLIDKAAAFFMSKVTPLIGNPIMNVSDNLFSLASLWCPIRLFAEFTLRFSQCFFFLAKEAGISNGRTIREGKLPRLKARGLYP